MATDHDLDEMDRLECLRLAVQSAEINYNADGFDIGADTDKILKAAKKYFDFVTDKSTTEGN